MIGAIEVLASMPLFNKFIAVVIIAMALAFVLVFVVPAFGLMSKLKKTALTLSESKNPAEKSLKSAFSVDKTLAHLWREYADTLHRQQEFGVAGKQAVDVLRSTVPANSVFTTEAIVDARLWTEFFKHVPGIFTGLGIIGTFYGLITGLQAFKVSPDPEAVRVGLDGLMHSVSEAFIISATAISFAMLATFVERLFATILSKQIEEITARLDGFFTSGAGEEYLARLTRASEDSAAQSKILKDALVGDLERILTTLTDRQIEAHSAGIKNLGEDLAKGIAGTLAGPLDAIKQSAIRNGEGNSEAVTRLLTDVLAGFSQRLEDLFGGQIGGINKLQQQTIDALGSAVAKLNQMITAVEETGTKSADTLNERLLSALKDMDAHQKAVNETMAAFVDQLRGSVDQSQSETNRKLQETLAQVGTAVEAQIAMLREQGERSSLAQSERDGAVTARTDEMLRTLGSRVDDVLSALKAHLEQSAEAQIDRDRRVASSTDENINRLSAAVEAQLATLKNQAEQGAAAHSERKSAASARTNDMLRGLGTRVDEVLGSMRAQQNQSSEAQIERERRLAALTTETVERLSRVSEALMTEVRAVATEVQTAINAMRTATTTAVDRMNSGSETIFLAATEFKEAGQSVSGIFQQAEGLSHGLRQSAGSIAEASTALQGVVADHAGTRDMLAKMMEEMRGIIENAKREAGVTTEVISRIEAATQGLGQAQRQAEEYLAQVSKILTDSHETYNASLSNALRTQYDEFYARLTQATGMLSGAIQELAVTVQPPVIKRAAE